MLGLAEPGAGEGGDDHGEEEGVDELEVVGGERAGEVGPGVAPLDLLDVVDDDVVGEGRVGGGFDEEVELFLEALRVLENPQPLFCVQVGMRERQMGEPVDVAGVVCVLFDHGGRAGVGVGPAGSGPGGDGLEALAEPAGGGVEQTHDRSVPAPDVGGGGGGRLVGLAGVDHINVSQPLGLGLGLLDVEPIDIGPGIVDGVGVAVEDGGRLVEGGGRISQPGDVAVELGDGGSAGRPLPRSRHGTGLGRHGGTGVAEGGSSGPPGPGRGPGHVWVIHGIRQHSHDVSC